METMFSSDARFVASLHYLEFLFLLKSISADDHVDGMHIFYIPDIKHVSMNCTVGHICQNGEIKVIIFTFDQYVIDIFTWSEYFVSYN